MSLMESIQKHRSLLFEMLRYLIVGGISAVVDMAVNYLLLYHLFGKTKSDILFVAISVTAGFLAGLAVNFLLSNLFVFRTEEQRKKGKTFKAFLIYFLVGVIGYGLTVGLTLLGTLLIGEEGIWYLLLTCFVKGLVLIWNYAGRKIFVYKGQ